VSKVLEIGIVGCGAIGNSLAEAVSKDFLREAKVSALYDLDYARSANLSRRLSGNTHLAVHNLETLINKSDLVIECASAKSSWEIAQKVIACGRDIMIMSTGGVTSHLKELSVQAAKRKSKVYIPSGAIAGIDAVKAASIGKIKKVILTTRKNPLAFEGVKYVKDRNLNLAKIRKDKILFSGFAIQAVKYFPQNINVASVLSLAGIGPRKTLVQIIACPKVKRNIHEIRVESEAGTIITRTENVLHPKNPKTSFLAVLSAIATLKQILASVEIGT